MGWAKDVGHRVERSGSTTDCSPLERRAQSQNGVFSLDTSICASVRVFFFYVFLTVGPNLTQRLLCERPFADARKNDRTSIDVPNEPIFDTYVTTHRLSWRGNMSFGHIATVGDLAVLIAPGSKERKKRTPSTAVASTLNIEAASRVMKEGWHFRAVFYCFLPVTVSCNGGKRGLLADSLAALSFTHSLENNIFSVITVCVYGASIWQENLKTLI